MSRLESTESGVATCLEPGLIGCHVGERGTSSDSVLDASIFYRSAGWCFTFSVFVSIYSSLCILVLRCHVEQEYQKVFGVVKPNRHVVCTKFKKLVT